MFRNVLLVRKQSSKISQPALARFLTRAQRATRVRGTVNVLITSARELRGLNRRYRGKDKPTDVLSFPAMPGSDNGVAGDIAIAAEIAAANSRQFGHTPTDEVKILILHGLLHLAGYDHECDDGQMSRREERLRRELRLPASLIERTVDNSAAVKRHRPARSGSRGGKRNA